MLENQLQEICKTSFGKSIGACSNEEIYLSLLQFVKEQAQGRKPYKNDRKLYYISAEFLIGKLLSNNLINLGLFEEVKEVLQKYGKSIEAIEEIEPEPSLGNGGLGRLAACFLDSIASLGLNGDGIGLNYHLGLFKQVFEDHMQKEMPNPWIMENSWLRKADVSFDVPFKDFTLKSSLYNIDIFGAGGGMNQLHLFDLESVDATIVKSGIDFDKEDILHNLTLFLYPDDGDKEGQLLRIYQQYFMISNGAQLILKECKDKGYDLRKLYKHVVIQINDTHPSLVIPELIRLLKAEGIDEEEAIQIVSKTCAYTNHTILAEALEKWPLDYLEQVVPHLIPIIKDLDERIKKKFTDEEVAIIDENQRVHMAHLDIHYGFSVNGVAALHTEILINSELKGFYDIYPDKFNNKTNGITFRRWLLHCNSKLADYITSLIGDDYKQDAEQLSELEQFIDDENVLKRLQEIKYQDKLVLKDYIKETQNIDINENSIFDIQIKRLHEYKRQQMNALYVIHKYLEIKQGKIPTTPMTIIFGAKAAPAYTIAKDIIHLILCLKELINNDESVSPHLKVVMVENYNVTKASKLIPACDISEQISLASKEASGTGNMKFMLNGAITLGTLDGANVEIYDLVGDENIYIFGKSSEEVISLYENSDYSAEKYYHEDEDIRTMVDFIIDDVMLAIGNMEMLLRLHNELTTKDWFMTLLDLKEYIKVKDRAMKDYEDRESWSRKMLVNISKAGYFSSDRTIKQYNEEIWKL